MKRFTAKQLAGLKQINITDSEGKVTTYKLIEDAWKTDNNLEAWVNMNDMAWICRETLNIKSMKIDLIK